MDQPDSDRGDFSCRRAVDSSSYSYSCPVAVMIHVAVETVAMCYKNSSAHENVSARSDVLSPTHDKLM